MRLLIIGDGLLGPTIAEYADPAIETTVVGHRSIDITSPQSVDAVFAVFKPDVVVTTAAFHRLAECEAFPDTAFEVNGYGAKVVAHRAPTIYISTDYVFNDGGPHDESLPGNTPRSVYGRSKQVGELNTLEAGGVVVRVSGLFGHFRSHKGPSFPEAILSSHDPIRLPTDQRFSPTYAPDAAQRILEIATDPKREGIYHAANKGATSWAEFAESILAYTRHDRHILPYRADDDLRPRDSSLKSTRLKQLPHWVDGLGRWAQREGRVEFVSPKRDA